MTTTTTLNPDELHTLASLGHLHLTHERWDEARAVFEGLTTVAPRMAYAWRALGAIARQQGDASRASQYLKHAVQLDPGDAEGRVELAQLLLTQGDQQGAWEALAPLQQELAAQRKRPLEALPQALRRARTLLRLRFQQR